MSRLSNNASNITIVNKHNNNNNNNNHRNNNPLFGEDIINEVCCNILNRLLVSLNCLSGPIKELHELSDGVILVEIIECFEEIVFKKQKNHRLNRSKNESNLHFVERWLEHEGIHLDTKQSIHDIFNEIHRGNHQLRKFINDLHSDDNQPHISSVVQQQQLSIYARSIAYIAALCYAVFTIFLKNIDSFQKVIQNFTFQLTLDEHLHILFFTKWKLTEEEVILKDLEIMKLKDMIDVAQIQSDRSSRISNYPTQADNFSQNSLILNDKNQNIQNTQNFVRKASSSSVSSQIRSGKFVKNNQITQNNSSEIDSISSITISLPETRNIAVMTDIYGLEHEIFIKKSSNHHSFDPINVSKNQLKTSSSETEVKKFNFDKNHQQKFSDMNSTNGNRSSFTGSETSNQTISSHNSQIPPPKPFLKRFISKDDLSQKDLIENVRFSRLPGSKNFDPTQFIKKDYHLNDQTDSSDQSNQIFLQENGKTQRKQDQNFESRKEQIETSFSISNNPLYVYNSIKNETPSEEYRFKTLPSAKISSNSDDFSSKSSPTFDKPSKAIEKSSDSLSISSTKSSQTALSSQKNESMKHGTFNFSSHPYSSLQNLSPDSELLSNNVFLPEDESIELNESTSETFINPAIVKPNFKHNISLLPPVNKTVYSSTTVSSPPSSPSPSSSSFSPTFSSSYKKFNNLSGDKLNSVNSGTINRLNDSNTSRIDDKFSRLNPMIHSSNNHLQEQIMSGSIDELDEPLPKRNIQFSRKDPTRAAIIRLNSRASSSTPEMLSGQTVPDRDNPFRPENQTSDDDDYLENYHSQNDVSNFSGTTKKTNKTKSENSKKNSSFDVNKHKLERAFLGKKVSENDNEDDEEISDSNKNKSFNQSDHQLEPIIQSSEEQFPVHYKYRLLESIEEERTPEPKNEEQLNNSFQNYRSVEDKQNANSQIDQHLAEQQQKQQSQQQTLQEQQQPFEHYQNQYSQPHQQFHRPHPPIIHDQEKQNQIIISRLLAELSYEKTKNARLRQTNQEYI